MNNQKLDEISQAQTWKNLKQIEEVDVHEKKEKKKKKHKRTIWPIKWLYYF